MQIENMNNEEIIVELKKSQFEIAQINTSLNAKDKEIIDLKSQLDALKQAIIVNQERNYQELVSKINEVIIKIDFNHRIVFTSPNIERIFGYRPEEILGKTIFEFIPNQQREFLLSAKKALLNADKSQLIIEGQIFNKNREIRQISVSAYIDFDNGEVKFFMGTISDITTRKQIENELVKKDILYHSVVDASPDVITITDLNGKIEYCSNAALLIYNIQNIDEIIGKNILEFVTLEDRLKATQSIENMFKGIMFGADEYKGLRPDGSVLDIEVNAEFVKDLAGNPEKMVFVTRDISNRRKTETQLKESENKYQQLIENINDVVFELSPEGIINYISPAISHISGYLPHEVIGKNFVNFISPDDCFIASETLSNLAAKPNELLEIRLIHKEQYLVWVRITASPIFIDGVFYGARGTLIDIHEMVKTMEELRKRQEQLNKLFDSQTTYILHADLEGKAIYWNKKFENDYGYCYDFTKNSDFDSLKSINKYHHQRTIETVEKCIQNPGKIYQVELDKTLIDGRIRTTIWEFVSLLDKNGEPEGIQCMGIDITDRSEAVKAMKSNEKKYRTLFVNSPIPYFIIQDGVFVELNPAAEILYGSDRKEVLGKTPLDISPEYQLNGQKSDKLANEIYNIPLSKGKTSFDWVHIRQDLSEFIVEVNLSAIDFQNKPAVFISWQDITEKRKAEELVRKLSHAVEQSPVSIVITDLNGEIEYANQQTLSSTGYTLEELKGNTPRILKSGETQQNEYDNLWKQITNGNIWTGQFHNKRKNGELYWEQSTIAPIIDNQGNTTHFIAIKEDITERKNIETALIQSEIRLSQVLEQSLTVVWEIDKNAVFKYVSSNSFQVWGYHPDELVDKHDIMFLMDAKQKEEFMQIGLDTLTKYGIIKDIETPIKHKDGHIIWTNSTAFTLKNEKGEFIGFRGSGKDITQQRKSQDEIRKFRTISDQANYGNAIADLNGILIYVNNAFAEMHDYSPNELVGKHLSVLHNQEQLEFVNFLMEKTKSDHGFKAKEVWHAKKDATTFPTLMNTRLVFDDQGFPIYIAASVIDITDLKNSEIALKKSEEQLNFAQEMAKMGSWEMDLIANTTSWSKNYYRLLEMDPESNPLMFSELQTMVHPDDRKLFDELLQNLNKNWSIETMEYRMIMDDGYNKWIQSNMIPVFEDDMLVAINGISVDITDKKNSEERIIDQNNRLTAILNGMPDMIAIMNKVGDYLEYYNPQPDLSLNALSNFDHKNVKDIFNAETSELHLKMINECISENSMITYEYQLVIGQEIRFFEARMVKMNDNKVLQFVRNITEKKQVEAELYQHRLAIEQSPVTIIITDLQGNITYASPAFEKNTGYLISEIIGQNINILKSGKTNPNVYKELWSTITSGDIWEGEWINKKKNSEFYWEHISITPVRNEYNNTVSYLAIKQDITDRKKQEETILELNSTLEKKVEIRTHELENANEILKREINERIAIELSLNEKSQELENFFSVSLDLLCISDMKGNFIRVNKAWETTIGYTVDELHNMNFMNLIHEDDIVETQKVMAVLSDQAPVINFINRYRTKEGHYKYIEWHSAPSGNLIYAAARDITQRKRAEKFELEMLELTPKLTRISYLEIKNAINLALERIGKVLDSDRVYIFEFHDGQTIMDNTYEWCNTNISPEIDNLKDLPVEIFPKWMETLHQGNHIQIYSVEDLNDEWKAEREILEPQGVQSLIVMPMVVDNKLIGFVGLDSVKAKRSYNQSEINILRILSSILSSLIHNLETENLLEQSRENFKNFFNTIDDFIWVLDLEANIIHANETVYNRLGYSTDEILNKNVLLVHPENRREEAGNIVKKMLEGDSIYCPVPLLRKNGQQIPVETRVKFGRWNGSDAILGISKDISQIKLSEQKFSTAFEANAAGMSISLLSSGHYIDINNSLLEILQYQKEEVIGKTDDELDIFIKPTPKDYIIENIKSGNSVRKLEVQLKAKNNEIKTVLLSADFVYIGKDECLITVIIDITDRKKAEVEILKARKEADLANKAKSEFLSRMSHELRTPLNSILGFAQLLRMSNLGANQFKRVNHILNGGKHLLELINEILDLSKIEAGKIALSIQPLMLNDIIQEIIDTLAPAALSKQIAIKTEFLQTTTATLISADKQRLKQILLNLINNSIKYNNVGGSIIIKTEWINYSIKPMIRTSIIDNGIGISNDNLEKLFSPFERIGAEKFENEGTGLGLAVVKKLVEIMNGNIGVESELGIGSTFWFELPFSTNDFNGNSYIPNELTLIPDRNEDHYTILYIEDNQSNIELVDQILGQTRPNIKLIYSNYGKPAIKLASEIKPNLILLDLNLPDIHGSELLQLLLSNQSTQHIPIIIVSADAMPIQLKKLIKLGAKAYITKPLDVEVLLSVIDKNLI